MKIIECDFEKLPKGLMRMFDGLKEEAIVKYEHLYGCAPKIAFLVNGVFWIKEPNGESVNSE